jgi:zinc transporter 9
MNDMILKINLFLCIADGIALGAAATTSHTDVEMIVFFAIMLHKVSFISI